MTPEAPAAGKRRWRDSLGFRFIMLMVVGEIVFGVALGLVVGLIGVRLVADQRVDALEDVSGVVAASLMPVIADQNQIALEAQLRSIVSLAQTYQIDSIRIEDSAGVELAQTGQGDRPAAKGPLSGVVAALFGPTTVSRHVVIDGIDVATVTVVFAPVGVESVLTTPLLAAALVVVAIGLVSAPWSIWLVMRNVIEPVTELRDQAVGIVLGERAEHDVSSRADEIGELAETLDWMADELDLKEKELLTSLHSLEAAYETESAMKRDLQHLMRLRSDFVAVASHELLSPLATVRLYGEMLESGVYGDMTEESRQAVASMVFATGRLSAIVSDMMDAALLQRGLMPLAESDVDIPGLVAASVSDGAVVAATRKVEVVTESRCAPCIVRGDPVRLRQVLDNLISNAVKYSYEGGTVQVLIECAAPMVRISVVDSGQGMPEEGRDALFELFGRMDSNDARDVAGIGLGLAISRRIAVAHRGKLYVERSAPGQGSVFVLELPMGTQGECTGLPATVSME